MFKTGDRISRDSEINGVTFECLGNVTYADTLARFAHVVFDNHTNEKPIVCTFESLRLADVKLAPYPHEGFLAAEAFHDLVEDQKMHGRPRDIGSSVAALRGADSQNTRTYLMFGRITQMNTDGDNVRAHIITPEGETWSVPMQNVVAV